MFLDKSKDELLSVFTQNLLPTNRSFNYYVDWSNISDYSHLKIEIHAIDVLIAVKDDNAFYKQFTSLLQKLPSTISLFPYLFGLAKEERKTLYNGKESLLIIQEQIDSEDDLKFFFPRNVDILSKEDIQKYYLFFERMGLKNLYQNIIEKSTLDYIVGVLVGLDSNGRKNRGGKAFELACKPIFEKECSENGLILLFQKKFKELRNYGFDISEDMENRKADFIVLSLKNQKAMNFEVNFYNGTGSKPEEIIDSYINRQNDLSQIGIQFSLVTDGKDCWCNASSQLQKGFRHLDYLQNYYMLKHGMLEEIINKVFIG